MAKGHLLLVYSLKAGASGEDSCGMKLLSEGAGLTGRVESAVVESSSCHYTNNVSSET